MEWQIGGYARGVEVRERVWMRSHTFFIVTWLEDVYFYSDFLCVVVADVA